MPSFEYTAINKEGRTVKGAVDADSVRAARLKLRGKSIFPTDIKESIASGQQKTKDIRKFLQRDRVSMKDLAVLTRQLGTLVGAGLPLVASLNALSDQTDTPVLRRIVVEVREAVEEGSSLAKALAAFPKAFPRLYVNMIAAGEASGTLDKVLNKLADYLEAQLTLRSKVRSALFYPILMLVMCALVIVGLFIYVVPRIVEIFVRKGHVLPFPTRVMMWLSYLIINYGIFAFLALLALIWLARWYYKQEEGKRQVDRLLLRIPIFSPIYIKVAAARTALTLGTLLASGVQLLTALDITKRIMGNVHYQEGLEQARIGVQEGRSLAAELSKTKLYPSMLSHMIAVGEKSGELELMVEKAGTAYESEVKATLEGLSSLLEPLITVVVGIIVFFIVISVLLPMADLMNVVQQ